MAGWLRNSNECGMFNRQNFFGGVSKCDISKCRGSGCACKVDWNGKCRMLNKHGRACGTGYCSVCMCRKGKDEPPASVLKLKHAKYWKKLGRKVDL